MSGASSLSSPQQASDLLIPNRPDAYRFAGIGKGLIAVQIFHRLLAQSTFCLRLQGLDPLAELDLLRQRFLALKVVVVLTVQLTLQQRLAGGARGPRGGLCVSKLGGSIWGEENGT